MSTTREIRFRVWDSKGKRYVPNYEPFIVNANYVDEPCPGLEPGQREWQDVNPVFEQFTGQRDKNGVDVFEGDVVRYSWARDEHDYETDVGEVFWSHESAAFLVDRHNEFGWRDCNFLDKTVEVLGNIHQNKELLKT